MLSNLFDPEEDIEAAAPIVGYKILQLIGDKHSNKVSIFDVADRFKHERWFSFRRIHLALVFLYSVGLIEFEQPYIVNNAEN